MRKWSRLFSLSSISSAFLYLVFAFPIADMCFHIINFTDFAWLGFLILGVYGLGGLQIVFTNLYCLFNYFSLREYLKENNVKVKWWILWGLPASEVIQQIESQQILLERSEDAQFLPLSKTDDIKYLVKNYTRNNNKS